MTQDELKALWAELGENHYNHRIGDYANEIPPGPPRPGSDECDSKRPPRSTRCSRPTSAASSKPLLANLRAFPPRGTTNEVWNHGDRQVHRQLPRRSPAKGPRAVRLEVELARQLRLDRSTARTTRTAVVNYEYTLVYGLDGQVDETNPSAADWISVGGEALFAPLNVLEVVESRWRATTRT